MKLATMKDGSRDGHLVIVARNLSRAVSARPIARTLQDALDRWRHVESPLRARSDSLNAGQIEGTIQCSAKACAAPLPRAYHWCDGSAFLNHGCLMQQAFGSPPIPEFETIPFMYQGGSDDFLGPVDDLPFSREADGIDFKGQFGVITDDVPMGVNPEAATAHIRLVVQLTTGVCGCTRNVSLKPDLGSTKQNRRPPSRRSPSVQKSSATHGPMDVFTYRSRSNGTGRISAARMARK